MQAFGYSKASTNQNYQMDTAPSLSVPPDNALSGGAEAGAQNASGLISPASYFSLSQHQLGVEPTIYPVPLPSPNNATQIGPYTFWNITPHPTTVHGDASNATPSVRHVCPSCWVNGGVLRHFNSATFHHDAFPMYPSITQGQFNAFPFGVPEQTFHMTTIAGDLNGLAAFDVDPVQALDNQFGFTGHPMQNNAMGFATSGHNMSSQWPLEGTLHDQFTPPEGPGAQSLASNEIQIPCDQLGCFVTFKRDTDRIRHEAAVYDMNQGLHLCPVNGCSKNQGRGYTRKDKLTKHMWRKHANLGYAKRV